MIPKKDGKVTTHGDDGKEYTGYYHFERGILTVTYDFETEKATLPPGSDPEPMAKIMLASIIKKTRKK
jgi:hypothetical protein